MIGCALGQLWHWPVGCQETPMADSMCLVHPNSASACVLLGAPVVKASSRCWYTLARWVSGRRGEDTFDSCYSCDLLCRLICGDA